MAFSFDGVGGFPVVKQAQSTCVLYINEVTLVYRATITATVTLGADDVVRWYLATRYSPDASNDESDWEEVELGVEHTFTVPKNALFWRAVLVGTGGSSTYISEVFVTAKIGGTMPIIV